MLRLASECGLLGPLGDSAADEWAHGAAATGQAALLVTLRARVRRRVRELWDCGRLGTALTHFKKYLSATGRVPFMPVERAGDITSLVYNQETLELFAEWLRSTGGQKADTIAGYVSVIKGLRDAEAHYHVTSDVVNTAMPRAFKRYRQIDGPPGERKLTHGFRAYMFRELVSGGYTTAHPRAASYDGRRRSGRTTCCCGEVNWALSPGRRSAPRPTRRSAPSTGRRHAPRARGGRG